MGKTNKEQLESISKVMNTESQFERYCQVDRLQACLNFYEKTGQGDKDIELCGDYYDHFGKLKASHMLLLRHFITANHVDIKGWM